MRVSSGTTLLAVPLALALLVLLPVVAAAQPAPPGPPPGNGADLPPPPGTAPDGVPPGTPGAVPPTVTGPGLLGSSPVKFNKTTRTLSLQFACQTSGTVNLASRVLSRKTLATAKFTCTANRAAARLTLTKVMTKSLVKRKSVPASASIKQGSNPSAKVYFVVNSATVTVPERGFWTDGHLQCSDSTGVPQAFLVEPDFTTAAPTPISTRGWVAWFTEAGGWHWLGVGGENAGRWDTWTANVTGISQFHPAGSAAPVPFTMGPIAIPPAQGIVAVGVYEIVYWVGGKPDYQWQYVNAGTTGAAAAGGGNLFCQY